MLGFNPYFDIVSPTLRPHFIPNQIPCYSFLSEAQLTRGLLNADRRKKSFQNFQGPYRKSNPEPPVLWHSASTNWTPLVPVLKPNLESLTLKLRVLALLLY
jgi:hypothetical protein